MFSLLAADAPEVRHFTADQVLSPHIYVFYAAYLVALAFTPILRHIAIHYGIIDQPDGLRKMHARPVAYLGGVAVFLGWLAGLALSQFLLSHWGNSDFDHRTSVVIPFSMIVGACAIIMVGLWDDIVQLAPWRKLSGQVFAAGALLSFGVGRTSAWLFIEPILRRTIYYFQWPLPTLDGLDAFKAHWFVPFASAVFVTFVIIACCNATNLMDGLDGLCGGVTAVIAGGFLFLAVHLAMSNGVRIDNGPPIRNINPDALRVILGLALLGGVLGFVPFNFNPASIFMGDTGSMFLGFACALQMILFADSGDFKWFLAAVVMFSLPMLDMSLAFVRRWVNGRPIFSADRFHLHHQLVARGFSVKQTVLISYGLSFGFCLLGAVIVFIRVRYAVAIYLVVFGSIIVAAYKMGLVHERYAAAKPRPLGANAASAAVESGQPLAANAGAPALHELAGSATRPQEVGH